MSDNWNALDNFIATLRYRQIYRFIPEQGIVCDVGCGMQGEFLHRISSRIKHGYGFDMKVNDSVISNIELINCSDIHKGLPLENNTVDCVFLLAVLEHLEVPEKIMAECFRILKPGGMIVLTTPTPLARPILEFMAFRLHIINENEILDHKHYFSRAEVQRLFQMTGFINSKYSTFLFGLNGLAYANKA